MSTVFFFYTLAFLTLCLVTSVISFVTYGVARRRMFAYGGALFLAYAAETCEIFFYEYLWQNVPFPSENYYDVSSPIIRTLVAAVASGCVWLMVLELLEREKDPRSPTVWAPILIFVVASLLPVYLMQDGPLRQWSYYITRTVFLFFSFIYLGVSYRRLPEGRLRTTLEKYRRLYKLILVLGACVAIEDTLVILILPESSDLIALYLSERNFSENVLAVVYAFFLLKYASSILSIRLKEAPKAKDVTNLDRAIDEHMPRYQEKNGLSDREAEVLALVLQGKSNQEIASELVLAVGTVKTHVHNIMKKCDQPSREALTLDFWRS